jgi:hypothetical protein
MTKEERKNHRFKLLMAVIITAVVFVGLQSQVLVRVGILSLNHQKPVVELDALAKLGVDTDALERDVTRLVATMSNAQQGNHFIFGMISGLIFSQPAAGLTVGILKESVDFVNNYRDGRIGGSYLIDAVVDTTFWALGGFVGFYLLSAIYGIFRENDINNPKDLVVFLGKKFRR